MPINSSYKQIVCAISEENYSPQLCEQIMARIEHLEVHRLRIRATVHGIIAVVAFIAIIPVAGNFFSYITQSEFVQYASLLFSDWSILVNNWKEIILSIAGSLPIVWLILFISTVIVIAHSLRRTFINTISLSTYKHAHLQ